MRDIIRLCFHKFPFICFIDQRNVKIIPVEPSIKYGHQTNKEQKTITCWCLCCPVLGIIQVYIHIQCGTTPNSDTRFSVTAPWRPVLAPSGTPHRYHRNTSPNNRCKWNPQCPLEFGSLFSVLSGHLERTKACN